MLLAPKITQAEQLQQLVALRNRDTTNPQAKKDRARTPKHPVNRCSNQRLRSGYAIHSPKIRDRQHGDCEWHNKEG